MSKLLQSYLQIPNNGGSIFSSYHPGKRGGRDSGSIGQRLSNLDSKYPRKRARNISSIIKIAEVYDALVSNRQYKKAWLVERACDIIHQGQGREFDAKISEVFLEHYAPVNWNLGGKKENTKSLAKDIFPELMDLAKVMSINGHVGLENAAYPLPSSGLCIQSV